MARVDYNLSDLSGNVAAWNIAFYHNNPVGAPIQTTDQNGNVSWTGQMDPFGSVLPNPNITQNLRLPGQYFDAETSLHYNMQRYYDPLNGGRYLPADRIGLGGGTNQYIYSLNDPLNLSDPTGEIAVVPILVGIGTGIVFDYAVSKWKEKNCSCTTGSGAVVAPALGAATSIFGPFATKPRTGIAGGGLAGDSTSVYSQAVHEAYESKAINAAEKRIARDTGRYLSKVVPLATAAYVAFELYDAFRCDH
ncbi:MAG: RHS repeat-associated core domain-containing protein [Flavisolibacter sp.]